MYKGISIGGTYAQYNLGAFVLVPNIDETITDALTSVDKSMYPSVASNELATITSDYTMIDDLAGFAHSRCTTEIM
jgi:hypothetical protein